MSLRTNKLLSGKEYLDTITCPSGVKDWSALIELCQFPRISIPVFAKYPIFNVAILLSMVDKFHRKVNAADIPSLLNG